MIRTFKKMVPNRTMNLDEFINTMRGRLDSDIQRINNAEAQAKEFFSHKVRKAYYSVDGYDITDHNSGDSGFVHFSDEEVDRIEELVVKEINKYFLAHYDAFEETPDIVNTIKGALRYKPLCYFFEQNEELRSLVLDRCTEEGMYPTNIDLETRYYFYRFFYVVYNAEDHLLGMPFPFFVSLTDEEYIKLLQYQLENLKGFNFNRLIRIDIDLAQKINNCADAQIYGLRDEDVNPYIIILDEVLEDIGLYSSKFINEDSLPLDET